MNGNRAELLLFINEEGDTLVKQSSFLCVEDCDAKIITFSSANKLAQFILRRCCIFIDVASMKTNVKIKK